MNDNFFKVGTFIVLVILVNFAWISFVIWLGGSVLTSGIKAGTDSCGSTYGAEVVFSGDWFCPND